MNLTIDSRKLGHEIAFYRPGSDYIFVDLTPRQTAPGTLGQQICDHGSLMGSTMGYRGESQAVFERICRRWWKAYTRNL